MEISNIKVAPGVHRIKFEAYDKAGNKAVIIRMINVTAESDVSTVQLVPDDPTLESKTTLSDSKAIEIYNSELRARYEECAVLTPVTETVVVENGRINLNETIEAGNVLFYEIG